MLCTHSQRLHTQQPSQVYLGSSYHCGSRQNHPTAQMGVEGPAACEARGLKAEAGPYRSLWHQRSLHGAGTLPQRPLGQACNLSSGLSQDNNYHPARLPGRRENTSRQGRFSGWWVGGRAGPFRSYRPTQGPSGGNHGGLAGTLADAHPSRP